MVKIARYTILDNFYFDVVKAISDELNTNGIPYIVVGGTAYQMKLAELVSNEKNLDSNEYVLGAFLRKTGDIDLSVRGDLIQIVQLFNVMAATTPSFTIQNLPNKSLRIERNSESIQVSYQTESADLRGLHDFYDNIIDTADDVVLWKGNRVIRTHIPHLDYLLASKLIRMKEKDKVDISNLLNAYKNKGENITSELESTRRILKFLGKENKFDYISTTAYGY